MLKSNNKKGYTIIEVICSLMMISLLLPLIFKIHLMNIRVEKFVELSDNNISVLEAVKNELYYNCSFEKIVDLAKNNKIYIDEENFNLNYIYGKDISQIFSKNLIGKYGMKIIVDISEVLKITLRLNYWFQGKEEIITCTFYKGNY